MAFEQQKIAEPLRLNPYTVPPEQQGWRGLGVSGENARRRIYTLLWNEQVLVCGLLLFPGERTIRHSHESGELSISFSDPLRPSVSYIPGGLLHAGPSETDLPSDTATLLAEALTGAQLPKLNQLLEQMMDEQRELRKQVAGLRPPGPRMLIDITFPPFKTTIEDPAYPEPRTIVGPWYD